MSEPIPSGQSHSLFLEGLGLLEYLAANQGTNQAKPDTSEPVRRAPKPGEAVAGYCEDFSETLFQAQEVLVDYQVALDKIAKEIPAKLTRTSLKIHSKALGLFRWFAILTGINMAAIGAAIALAWVKG